MLLCLWITPVVYPPPELRNGPKLKTQAITRLYGGLYVALLWPYGYIEPALMRVNAPEVQKDRRTIT